MVKVEISREQAERHFAHGVKLFVESVNRNKPIDKQLKFVMDEEFTQVSSDLIDYMRNAKDSKLDISKGIFLGGNVGSRKTSLFKILSFANFPGNRINVIDNSCQMITEKFIKSGFDGVHVFTKPEWTGILDDFGREIKGKYFGNEIWVITYVLQQMYKNFLSVGYRPFITSNFDIPEIDSMYSSRDGSIISEMCNITYLGGDAATAKDWRRPEKK